MEDFLGGFEGPEQPVLRSKTIDVKLIVGIVIILFSILAEFGSKVIEIGGIYNLKFDDAYFVGRLLGVVFFSVIISAVILVISKKNRGRDLLIYSIIALVLSFSHLTVSVKQAIDERQKQELAVNKVTSLAKDLVSQKEIVKEDISKEKYGKSAELVELVQNFYLDIQALSKETENILGIMNDPSTFSKETLSDLNKIKEKRTLLDKTTNDIEALRNKATDLMNKLKTDVSNLKEVNAFSDGFKAGMEDSTYKTTEDISNNLKYLDNVIKCIRNMVAFLEGKQGAYTFEGDQLAFYKDEDVSAYNKLFAEYNKAIDENNKNYENIQKKINEKIEDIEKITK